MTGGALWLRLGALITGVKLFNFKKGTFFAGFVNEVVSAKKVGNLRFPLFMKNRRQRKKIF
jgi:hypothetical protein